MRAIPTNLQKKLRSRIQAGDNSLSASLWVGRPTTPLTDDRFLEKQTILQSSNITKSSIAVCHPRLMRGATNIFVGFIESGTAKVYRAMYTDAMEKHHWIDTGFSEWAEDIALCFDGTMPKAPNGWAEFKTDDFPWVFWTRSQVLYGKRLDSEEEGIVLAQANCTAVSAVRAMWSYAGSFDFGLVVFFILSGVLYYRQLIGGEWKDAETVSFGPDLVWEDVAAFRTWDYRIGVQLKATTGEIYELFTQYMGIGKQNAEHIEIKDITIDSDLIKLNYHNTASTEHLEITDISAGAPYGGLYSTLEPKILFANNKENDEGDWGKLVVVVFDTHLDAETIAANHSAFTITDANGVAYAASSASLSSEDAKTITLEFPDFNAASGECVLAYTPGTAESLAGTVLTATSVTFTPENLNPPQISAPEPIALWNMNSDGTRIAIRFSEALTGDTSGNESKFTIKMNEYDHVPDGTLSEKTRTVSSIEGYIGASVDIDLSLGEGTGLSLKKNKITLEVAK